MPRQSENPEVPPNPESASEASRKVAREAYYIIGNALSVFTSNVLNRGTTFVLYLLVGRYLGTLEFGQLSLSTTLLQTFWSVSVEGLKTYITRQVAGDKARTNQYLVNGSLIAGTAALLSMLLMILFARAMNYSTSTEIVLGVISLSLLPLALSAISEAIFQAWERMQYIAYVNGTANIVKVALTFILLSQGRGLYQVVVVLPTCYIVIMVIEWWLVSCYISRPHIKFDLAFCWKMIRDSSAFYGINVILAIRSSLMVVMISKLTNEVAVGLYSAATQLMVPLSLVFESIALSVFPVMCRKFGTGIRELKQFSEQALELTLAFAFPAAVGLFFYAGSAIMLLYHKDEFLPAAGILQIIVWLLIPKVFTMILGRVFWAAQREKTSLIVVVTSMVLWFMLGLLLIGQFGLVGSAVALLACESADLFMHYVPLSRIFTLPLLRLLVKPVLASLCMALYLVVVGGRFDVFTISSAGFVYGCVLLALVARSSGGIQQVKARYQYLWSK